MSGKKGVPHRRWSKEEKLKIVKEHLDEHESIRAIERKEELYIDFDLAHCDDVPKLLDEYVRYFNEQRLAAALNYKSPIQYRTESGF